MSVYFSFSEDFNRILLSEEFLEYRPKMFQKQDKGLHFIVPFWYMSISCVSVWLLSFYSLTASSMHPAMATWGSCPTSVARSTGAGCAHGPKTTPANPSTSPPFWDIRLAWPTPWGRCTALASVCATELTAMWMHGMFVWQDYRQI